MNSKKRLIGVAMTLCSITLAVHAQNYSIGWYKIAGGGGASAGGTYQVTGTIGQPDASGALTGGNYSLTGGFWSLISVVQTPGAPLLTIAWSGNQAIVSWPSSFTSWTLQTNGNPVTANWVNYVGAVINNSVTNSPATKNLFYRLKQ